MRSWLAFEHQTPTSAIQCAWNLRTANGTLSRRRTRCLCGAATADIIPAMEVHSHVPKIGKTPVHWLLEGVFIVASVLLASSVGQCREARQNHELASHVLENLRAEVEYNKSVVAPQRAMHLQWIESLDKADKTNPRMSGIDLLMAARPDLEKLHLGSTFEIFHKAAWDAAVSTGSMRLIDYDVAARLSEIYDMQQHVADSIARIPLGQSAFFDPAMREATTHQTLAAMSEITWTEARLLELYDRYLSSAKTAP
jgi:hypothetical protein